VQQRVEVVLEGEFRSENVEGNQKEKSKAIKSIKERQLSQSKYN
jgi:hypothetical protein